jgi:hypothetical protein
MGKVKTAGVSYGPIVTEVKARSEAQAGLICCSKIGTLDKVTTGTCCGGQAAQDVDAGCLENSNPEVSELLQAQEGAA